MDELVNKLKVSLADTFVFYLKSHYYHWNVEGPDFSQYHELLKEIYEEVFGAVDFIAEHIRTLDAYAPGSLKRFSELTTLEEDNTIPSSLDMLKRLLDDNNKVINTLIDSYKAAEAANEYGLANFIQDRIDVHKKHGWMLRATTKDNKK